MTNIPTFQFPKKEKMNLLKDIFKLTPFEQKNLTILITARHKLSLFLRKNDGDEFLTMLSDWLEKNVADYKDIEILYVAYLKCKPGSSMHNELFKIVKPLEQIATYLSEVAEYDMKIDWDINQEFVPPYILNLIDYWFNVMNKHTNFYSFIKGLDISSEIMKYNRQYKNHENKHLLHSFYDESMNICEAVNNYTFKYLTPIRTSRKTKSTKKSSRKK